MMARYPGCGLRVEFGVTDTLGSGQWREPFQYDAVTCMFAVHYFFLAEDTLKVIAMLESTAAAITLCSGTALSPARRLVLPPPGPAGRLPPAFAEERPRLVWACCCEGHGQQSMALQVVARHCSAMLCYPCSALMPSALLA